MDETGAKPAASLLNDLYNLYLRAGILAYLQEKFDVAARYLEAAGPARPTEGLHANFDREKIGLFILGELLHAKGAAWTPTPVMAPRQTARNWR